MISDYINAALGRAKYELLTDDKSFYGEIPVCNGVYATSSSLKGCRRELQEVLEEWVLFRVSRQLDLPLL